MIYFSKLGQMGRLSNQLFQIAATVSLAIDNNDSYMFPHWEYENNFNLYNCFSNNISSKKEYKEPFFHYQSIPYSEGLDICGYFQSEKYFSNNQDIILGLLTPKNDLGIRYNYTAIHVRRGDYLALHNCYEELVMEYYNKAIDIIRSKYYLIFSDDIEWCKKKFIGEQFIFSEGRSAIDDFCLLSSCEHQIMANSSFSWWAAYLNKNPNKVVVAPQKWFGPKLLHNNTKDLLIKDWIVI